MASLTTGSQNDTAGAHSGPGKAPALRAADWLCLAAAPTFALMALLTGVPDGNPVRLICAATQHASLLSGMAPMYWLMSAFHLAPWMRLISRRPPAASHTEPAASQPRVRHVPAQ